jgi:hypothetical protein
MARGRRKPRFSVYYSPTRRRAPFALHVCPPRMPSTEPTTACPPHAASLRSCGGRAAREARVVLHHLSLTRVLLPLLLLLPVVGGAAVPWTPDSRGIRAGWGWPLASRPGVIRPFDPPERPWLSGHRGVDLRATLGQEVRAPADGTVSFVGRVVDRDVVTIDHGHGLLSSFEPVESDLPRGAVVSAGQVVGRLAPTPMHCPGGCLHWGVRNAGGGTGDRGTDYVDPLRLVADTRPSVLLPWRDP